MSRNTNVVEKYSKMKAEMKNLKKLLNKIKEFSGPEIVRFNPELYNELTSAIKK